MLPGIVNATMSDNPFPNIRAKAFQHADDVKASDILVNSAGFSQIARLFSAGFAEKAIRLHLLSHAIRVGPSQAPGIWKQFVKAAETLAIERIPDLFLMSAPERNAFAMGIERPAIAVTTALADTLTEAELLAVLGHELGHVKCQHMTHKTIAFTLAEYGGDALVNMVPGIGGLLTAAIYAPLFHWSRMAEYSCDRAALLVVRDAEVVARVLAKFGGWSEKLGPVDFEGLRQQAKEYDDLDNDTMSAILKILTKVQSGIYLTHPLPIHRVKMILQWAESDAYKNILDGNYEKMDAPLAARRCPACGTTLSPGDRHCTSCGAVAAAIVAGLPTCAACGRPVPDPRPRFCSGCGGRLDVPGSVAD